MRVLCLCLAACSVSASVDQPIEESEEAIYGGIADRSLHDAVVLLTHETDDGITLCTGTLVAPRVVLTAAHCVVSDAPTYVSCGGSVSDRTMTPLLAAEIDVRTGWKPSLSGTPAAHGRRLFLPKLTTLCDRDVAVIVLDGEIAATPIAIASELDEDGVFTAVGYGLTEHGTTGERRRREGMRVVNAGPLWDENVWLGAKELETTAGPCSGDSGGPLLTADGEIVGVVSRGGSCRRNRGNIYSNAISWTALVDDAIVWADAHP